MGNAQGAREGVSSTNAGPRVLRDGMLNCPGNGDRRSLVAGVPDVGSLSGIEYDCGGSRLVAAVTVWLCWDGGLEHRWNSANRRAGGGSA